MPRIQDRVAALFAVMLSLLLNFAVLAAPPAGASVSPGFNYDMTQVAQVLDALKQAATSLTPGPIEPYVEYPFTAYHQGRKIVLRSVADLRQNFARIFNAPVRSAILEQKLADAFHNYQGVLIGGRVWISQICRDNGCRDTRYVIRTINF